MSTRAVCLMSEGCTGGGLVWNQGGCSGEAFQKGPFEFRPKSQERFTHGRSIFKRSISGNCKHKGLQIELDMVCIWYQKKASSDSRLCLTMKWSEGKSLSHVRLPARFLCPWDSPSKNTEVGWRFLLQGILLTQGWNPDPPHRLTIRSTQTEKWCHQWLDRISY